LQRPDNGGVYFVPAFVGLGAPYWDSYARGTIVGLSRGSTQPISPALPWKVLPTKPADVIDAMRQDSKLYLVNCGWMGAHLATT
jgi:glycerol kinase